MAANQETLAELLRKQAEVENKPGLNLAADSAQHTANLIRQFDGLEEMPGMIIALLKKAREKTTFVWKQRLVNFCDAFPVMTSQKPFDWQAVAVKFNDCFHVALTDETKISDLHIPTQTDFFSTNESLRNAAKRIDPKFKGAWNMKLNFILRGTGLDTTIGQIRQASDARLRAIRHVTDENVLFLRIAFARPSTSQ